MFAMAKDMYEGKYTIHDRTITPDIENQRFQAVVKEELEKLAEEPVIKLFRGGP